MIENNSGKEGFNRGFFSYKPKSPEQKQAEADKEKADKAQKYKDNADYRAQQQADLEKSFQDETDDLPKEPDGKVTLTVKTTYQVACQFAMLAIKMPYKVLSSFVNLSVKMLEQIQQLAQPFWNFAKSMVKMVYKLAKQAFDKWLYYFKMTFTILRNLPAFIQKYVTIATNFIGSFTQQAIDMLMSFSDMIQNILETVMSFPMKIFDLVGQMATLFTNMFQTLVVFPESIMNIGITLQNKMVEVLTKYN